MSDIFRRSGIRLSASAALAALALFSPALAAGQSTTKGPSSNTRTSSPPSRSRLPQSAALGTSVGTMPFAWVDDATLLPAGAGALTVSAASWHGTDVSEAQVPIVGAAVGIAPRLQLSARVPYIVDDAAAGIVGGWGTTFLSGKIGVVQNESGLKLSVAPTLEVIGSGAVTAGESRTQFGVPVSAEYDAGMAQAYASAGYFSGGVGFVGAGATIEATPHLALSASLSHSWSTVDTTTAGLLSTGVTRTELSGGVSVSVTSHVGIFGAVSQTIGTTDANGAGTTLVAGVSFVASPRTATKTITK